MRLVSRRSPSILFLREKRFIIDLTIVADRVVDRRLRDRLSSGALFFVDLIFAHGVFFDFRVCHARDLAGELVNGDDDGGGPPVGVYGKVASNSEDGVARVPLYTSNTHILLLIRLLIRN